MISATIKIYRHGSLLDVMVRGTVTSPPEPCTGWPGSVDLEPCGYELSEVELLDAEAAIVDAWCLTRREGATR